MAQDMTDNRADGLPRLGQTRRSRPWLQLAPRAPRAGQGSDPLERNARDCAHVWLSWAASRADHSAGGQAERHASPVVDRFATMGALVKRRHEPEFAQAGQ